jgi:hypothetical protein
MNESNGLSRSGLPRAWVMSVLAGLVAAAGSLLVLRHGIRVTSDGWSYWQGSVSILQGKGYHYFDGTHIRMWPPMYSLYLAGWQGMLGVSGRTLALANVALAAAASFTWTAAFLLPFRDAPAAKSSGRVRTFLYASLAGGFIAFTIIANYRMLLSQNLGYVLYPAVLYFAHQTIRPGRTGRAAMGCSTLIAVPLTLLLLTHNSFVCLLIPLGLVILRGGGQPLTARLLMAVVATGIPTAIWVAVRVWLRQIEGHKLSAHAVYSWRVYAHQALFGIAHLLGPERHHLGALLLAGVCLILVLSYARRREKTEAAGFIGTYLALSIGSLAVLYVIFNTTPIFDPLSAERFVLFVPLTLVPSAILLVWLDQRVPDPTSKGTGMPDASRSRPLPPAATALALALIACITVFALECVALWVRGAGINGGSVDVARVERDEGFAYNAVTIDSRYETGPAKIAGELILRPPAATGTAFAEPPGKK